MQENMEIYDGNTGNVYSSSGEIREEREQNREYVAVDGGLFAAKAYGFMAAGLAVSFVVALLTSLFFPTAMFELEFYILVIVGELIVAVVMGFAFRKLSAIGTGVLFFIYSVLTGFTLSLFMTVFGLKTFYLAFGMTGSTFLVLSIIGFVTKKDVARVLPTLSLMLAALILSSVIAFLIGGIFEMIVCGVGVLIIGAVTVYDIKKIRHFSGLVMTEDDYNKYVIYSAMQLYLDYINILLYLIRLLALASRKK